MTLDHPNIVLIHCHDLGQHLGCYGADVETPAIDRLADEGVRFENAFCTAPQCSPARGSLLTGRMPHNNGLMGLSHRGWSLHDDEYALPQYLRDAGYQTVEYGIQHAGNSERLGFEKRYPVLVFDDDFGKPWWPALGVAERFEETFEAELARSEPFYAHIGFAEPHQPYRHPWVPEGAYDEYSADAVEVPDFLPDTHAVRKDISELNAVVSGTVDPAVKRIREVLADREVLSDTLVVFTSDHGLDLPRGKGMCYRAGTNVPLLFRHPDFESAECEDLVSHVDVLPTLLDLLDLDAEQPKPLDGRSVAGSLGVDEPYERRDRVFTEITWHGRYNPIRSIRTETAAYHRSFTESPLVYMPYLQGRSARELFQKYYVPDRPMEQLYDLESDPLETENLAPGNSFNDGEGNLEDADTPDLLVEMRDILRTKLEADDDPLLDGPIPIPGQSGW